MNIKKLFFTLFIIHGISPITMHGKFSWKNVKSWVSTKKYEDTIQKEFHVAPHAVLNITNPNGTIEVTTEWKRNTIALSATTKASNADNARGIEIRDFQDDINSVTIETVFSNGKAKGVVDYQLIVPANLRLNIHSDSGAIVVNGTTGPVTADTVNGTITLEDTAGKITATSYKSGTIIIDQADGTIHTKNKKGITTIANAKGSIVAESAQGRIKIHMAELPIDNKMWAKSTSGDIVLDLPESTNAEIIARTERGTLKCDLPVTIHPYTTTLNRKSWEQFKREVNGTIGTSEAEIRLRAKSGSIKIQQYTA